MYIFHKGLSLIRIGFIEAFPISSGVLSRGHFRICDEIVWKNWRSRAGCNPLGFKVSVLGFRFQGVGFRVPGSRFRGFGSRDQGEGLGGKETRLMACSSASVRGTSTLWFRGLGLGLRV